VACARFYDVGSFTINNNIYSTEEPPLSGPQNNLDSVSYVCRMDYV